MKTLINPAKKLYKYNCDSCGKEISFKNNTLKQIFIKIDYGKQFKQCDLCEKCLEKGEYMENSGKKAMILRMEHLIDEELALLNETGGTIDEKLEKGDVLFNIYKFLKDYDELEPILKDIFAKKAEKNRFETEER